MWWTVPMSEPVDATAEVPLPKDRPRGVLGRILSGVLSYGVVGLIIWFLVQQLTTPSQSESALESITFWQVVVIVILGLLNLLTNLPPIMVTLPGLRLREAAVTNTASAALSNTVPEGGAVATGLNFAMLRSWGFRLNAITSSFLVTGVWTNFVRYTLMAGGLVIMVLRGKGSASLLWITLLVVVLVVVAIILFGLILRSESFAKALGRFTNRLGAWSLKVLHLHRFTIPDMEEQVALFRTEMISLIRGCWWSLTLWMILSQLSACLVLGVALRMQGINEATIPWAEVVVAFGACSLASLIAPTPGGLGVVEATLLAVLSAGLPDSYRGPILAAIVLYRIATWLLPIPIGAVSYLYWRNSTKWRRTEADRYGTEEAAVVS